MDRQKPFFKKMIFENAVPNLEARVRHFFAHSHQAIELESCSTPLKMMRAVA